METVDDQTVRSEVVTAIQPVSMLPNVIELSYYSNTLLTHYVMESAVGKNNIYTFSWNLENNN